MRGVETNFGFLEAHSPLLCKLAQQAERYFAEDPSTALIKLRQFGEVLARQLAALTNTSLQPNSSQVDVINALRYEGSLSNDAVNAFHALRKSGNKATHEMTGAHSEALTMLKVARALGSYYHQLRIDRNFRLGPFIPPPDPKKQAAAVAEQMAALQQQLQDALQAQSQAQAIAEAEAKARARAEADALVAAEEAAAWSTLVQETEKQLAEEKRLQEELLAQIQEEAAARPAAELQQVKAEATSTGLELDEIATRQLIDEQLREVGWEVDSVNYRYAKGVRPQKGRNLAVAEWPTASGPADYVLFIGLMPIAIVEAKRKNKNVKASIEQAKRYSEGIKLSDDLLSPGGPWNDYKVPFLFSTNGRGFLRQLLEFSGIWFLDARLATHHSRALEGWYTPDGLMALLKKDIPRATLALESEELDYLGLRPYQNQAIKAVEARLAEGRDHILLAMATGTRQNTNRHRADLSPAKSPTVSPHSLSGRPQRAGRAGPQRVQRREDGEPADLRRHLRGEGPRRSRPRGDHQGSPVHRPGHGEALSLHRRRQPDQHHGRSVRLRDR